MRAPRRTYEDSEIEGTSDDVTAGLSFANYTARRVNVHGTADGFKADENVLIELKIADELTYVGENK